MDVVPEFSKLCAENEKMEPQQQECLTLLRCLASEKNKLFITGTQEDALFNIIRNISNYHKTPMIFLKS